MKLLALCVLALASEAALGLNLCTPCCTLVNFIKSEATRDEPQEQAALDAACTAVCHKAHLPDFLIKICDEAVNAGLKDVINALDHYSSTAACQKVDLCSGSQSCPSSFQLEDNKGNRFCAICDQLAAFVNASVPKAEQLCNLLEGLPLPQQVASAVKTVCDDIKNGAPVAEQILGKCKSLLHCPSMAVPKASPKLCPFCEYLKKMVDSGQIVQYCNMVARYVPKLAPLCAEIQQNTAPLDTVLQQCENMFCGSLQDVLESVDICGELRELEHLLDDPNIGKICMDALPAPLNQICPYLAKYGPKAASALEFLIKQYCGGSRLILADVLAAMPKTEACTVCHDVDNLLADGEFDQGCTMIGVPESQCQQIEGVLKVAMPMVEKALHCS